MENSSPINYNSVNYEHAIKLLFGQIPEIVFDLLDRNAPQFIQLNEFSRKYQPKPQQIKQAVQIFKMLALSNVPNPDAFAMLGWCYDKFGEKLVGYNEDQAFKYFEKGSHLGSFFALTQIFRQISRKQPLDVVNLFIPELQPIAYKGFKRARFYIALTFQTLGLKNQFKMSMYEYSGAPGIVFVKVVKITEMIQCQSDMKNQQKLLCINQSIEELKFIGQDGWLHVHYPLKFLYAVKNDLENAKIQNQQVQGQIQRADLPLIAFYTQIAKVINKWKVQNDEKTIFEDDVLLNKIK